MFEITYNDIPENHKFLVDKFGLEWFIELCRYTGGTTIYIPKLDMLEMNRRNREIVELSKRYTPLQLSRQFHISERRIRKIISGK